MNNPIRFSSLGLLQKIGLSNNNTIKPTT